MNNTFDAIMPIAIRPETVFVSGLGSFLSDDQGNTYLDFIQGWAVNTLGHCHPALINAIQNQAQTLINPSPGFYNAPMIQLADQLVEHSVFDHVFFTNSGAEANEGAIKLARKWGSLHKNAGHPSLLSLHFEFNEPRHSRSLLSGIYAA